MRLLNLSAFNSKKDPILQPSQTNEKGEAHREGNQWSTINMVTIRRSVAGPVNTTILQTEDLKTARKLKGALITLLNTRTSVASKVNFGRRMGEAKEPRRDPQGGWKAPNGDKLIKIPVYRLRYDNIDYSASLALVTPKTNQFYVVHTGNYGIGGSEFAQGPFDLPRGLKFRTKNLTPAEMARIQAAADQADYDLPTRQRVVSAFNAVRAEKLVKYHKSAPPEASVFGRVQFQSPDGDENYKYEALVMKTTPTTLVIHRTGNGADMYSDPFDMSYDVYRRMPADDDSFMGIIDGG